MMKIQFIWFNIKATFGMSIGVSILSRELMEAGHIVKVIHLSEKVDFPFDIKKILSECKKFNPDIFALSFGTNHFNYVKNLVPVLKRYFPKKLIICGGIHTTLAPEEVIGIDGIDIVCIGEVDNGIFVNFINKIENNKNYKNSKNFWIKENNIIHKNPVQKFPDIKNQTFLAYELIDYKTLTKLNGGFAKVIAGRGCPYKCTYCQNEALRNVYLKDLKTTIKKLNYYRMRKVENLIEELTIYCNKAGSSVKAILFDDDSLTSDKNWLKKFTKKYKEKINKPFICNVVPNQVDEEIVQMLDSAGCNLVKFGIESGSARIRNKMLNKPFSEKALIKAINLFKKYDINVLGYAMIGIPTETIQEVFSTFKLIASLKMDMSHCFIFYPFPKTKLYNYCESKNLILQDVNSTTVFETTKIKLSSKKRIFIEKVSQIYPWILNIYLNNSAAEKYSKLVDRVLKMPEKEWQETKKSKWIRNTSIELSEYCRKNKIPHYINPIPARPDTAFLLRERKKRIINIDDAPLTKIYDFY